MTTTDAPQTHAVLVARGHLLDAADAYLELDERLPGGGRSGGGVRTTPSSRPPLDPHVLTVRMEIAGWATWCARAVLDARDAAGQPWTPRSDDPADLLREVGEEHIGVFLADPLEAVEFFESADRYAHRARAAAWPSGARWIRLGVPCPEAGTDDAGQRVRCGGEYRMWMRPDQDMLGDMVCDKDTTHRITPSEWQRAMRRRPVDEAAAARLVRTIRLAGRKIVA